MRGLKRKTPGGKESGVFLSRILLVTFCNLEGKLIIIVLEGPDGDIPAHLQVLRLYVFCQSGEQLQTTAKVHNTHRVGRVRLEPKRRIIGSGKGLKLAFLGHLEPVHVL